MNEFVAGFPSQSPAKSPERVMCLTLPAPYAPGVQEEHSEPKEQQRRGERTPEAWFR
jgi:hypothetical protein